VKEAERIKDRLRTCATADEIEAVADQEREAVIAMHKDPQTKPLAIQIANLKALRMSQLGDEE
jgi:hypothetical protein